MKGIRRLCVYCGSSDGVEDSHRQAATELGSNLAGAGVGLVYGGGRVGLMGLLANAVLNANGTVIGVIPRRLVDAEAAHTGVTELVVVDSMHDRKRVMAEKADAFAICRAALVRSTSSSRSLVGDSSRCTTSRSCSSISMATGRRCAPYSTTSSSMALRARRPGDLCTSSRVYRP